MREPIIKRQIQGATYITIQPMKSASEILDGFPGYMKRKHKGRKMTTIADVRKRQEEYLEQHIKAAYREGYNACARHYQGRK